ncbi:MAG: hypothetical protein HZA19_00790, partial [Nitrospirae bacterium]|nr:hypothetical protein [Nitrospirota bacterium]
MKFFANSIKYKILSIAIVSVLGFIIYLGLMLFSSADTKSRIEKIRYIFFAALEKVYAGIENFNRIKDALICAVTSSDEDLVDDAKSYAENIDRALT